MQIFRFILFLIKNLCLKKSISSHKKCQICYEIEHIIETLAEGNLNAHNWAVHSLCVIFMILVSLENVKKYSHVVARLPQRLKSTLFEIFSNRGCLKGIQSVEKISNNVDFSLWSNRATTQSKFFDIFKWDQNHKNHT